MFEAFAGWVLVAVSVEVVGNRIVGRSRSTRGDLSAATVSERETVGLVGVPGDAYVAAMMSVVMMRTQTDQVGRVSRPIVGPVDDVMLLDVGRRAAAREPAAPVTVSNDPAGMGWRHPVGPSSTDRNAVGVPQRDQLAVTGQAAHHRLRHGRAGIEP